MKSNIDKIIKECLEDFLCRKKIIVKEGSNSSVTVYRGMDVNNNSDENIWVTDSKEYATYWAEKEYNQNGSVKKFLLANDTIRLLCDDATFEGIMNDYDCWQEIPDDSSVWENGEGEYDYDLMHDLCFPSDEQIAILKNEGYKGIIFQYTNDCYSMLIFNGEDLLEI